MCGFCRVSSGRVVACGPPMMMGAGSAALSRAAASSTELVGGRHRGERDHIGLPGDDLFTSSATGVSGRSAHIEDCGLMTFLFGDGREVSQPKGRI